MTRLKIASITRRAGNSRDFHARVKASVAEREADNVAERVLAVVIRRARMTGQSPDALFTEMIRVVTRGDLSPIISAKLRPHPSEYAVQTLRDYYHAIVVSARNKYQERK